MWYYDGSVKECRQFEYGGCEGNENRFNTQFECQATCANKKYKDYVESLEKSENEKPDILSMYGILWTKP